MSSHKRGSQTYSISSIDLGSPPPSFSSDSPVGDETLPPYTNHLRLASLCRRKREFQAAFDKTPRGRRTWELVWLVLDGTALRVYRPKSMEKKAVENNADLGLVEGGLVLVRTGTGSGDSTRPTSVARLPLGPQGRRGTPLDRSIASGETGSPSAPLVLASEPQLQLARSKDAQRLVDSSAPASSPSSSIEGQARRHRRLDSIAKVAPSPAPAAPPAYPSNPMVTPYSTSTPFLTSPPVPTSPSRIVYPATAATQPITLPDFSQRKACRQYHLQHAICMRADAYMKREHVLRFVLEDGKQFIVQLSSREETISWLQLMSIAAPLSLDLDERPMPEPAHYPRRRPRPRASAQRRPSTAPGALERSTPVTMQGTQGSLSAIGAASTIPSVPFVSDDVVDSAGVGGGEEGEEDEDDDEDPLIIEEDMDHLPPPRRPVLLRSLSSVEQARRRGIQL